MIRLDDFEQYGNIITNFVLVYGMKLVAAILTLLIGLWFIKRLNLMIYNLMIRKDVDVSLRPFLRNLLGIILRILLFILVIAQLGVEMTSFIAVLGSAGLAIGLALQGSLSNFAGGVLILTIKPFRVGDFIEAQGQSGTVHMINIFNTVIKTGNNQTIYMPNGPLASSVVINYSVEPTRRMELKLVISLQNDVSKVKELLQKLISEDGRILPEPAPMVIVTDFAEYSLTITMRIWARKEDFWNVYWDMNERVKMAFEEHGVVMPVQKREILNLSDGAQQKQSQRL